MPQGSNIPPPGHTGPGAHGGGHDPKSEVMPGMRVFAPTGGRNCPGGRVAPPLAWPHPSPVSPETPTRRRLLRPEAAGKRFLRPKGRAHASAGEAGSRGVRGVVPHSGHKPGKRAEPAEQGEIVVPLAGGESEGDHTVRPWGGRPVPFYSKAYPAMRRACRRWSDQPVKELQHIWVHSEQTFRRILCRYRIFLAGRSWRGWPQGRTGPRGPCAVGGAARRAGAPNG